MKDVTLVVNYDLPNEPEAYVHRIGRTGRAGATGKAVSFCSPEEREFLRDIEKLIQQTIPVEDRHDWHLDCLAERHARGGRGDRSHQERKKPRRSGRARRRFGRRHSRRRVNA